MKHRLSFMERIKSKPTFEKPKHFSFSTLSMLVLLLFFVLALVSAAAVAVPLDSDEIILLSVWVIASALIIMVFPLWPVVFILILLLWVKGYTMEMDHLVVSLICISLGLLLSPCFQVVKQWDKAVILRLGKFRRVYGPGPHLIVPIIDATTKLIDTRIRVTDFSAEKSLTKDTVPVHVDALAFWMVWDAKKTVLEVENYIDAVILSAQTALRDAIGRNDLATLLSERERLGSEIQSILDAKTSPWGITILSIEFTEILIPRELEDVLSKQAQAERERQSRIILGAAEVEIAKKFDEASELYKENPTAFQLRAMNMVYDSIRTHGGMVLMPSSAVESMSLGTTLGAAALQKLQRHDPPGEALPEQKQQDTADDHSN